MDNEKLYRLIDDQGYILAVAYLDEQDLRDANILLNSLPEKYHGLRWELALEAK